MGGVTSRDDTATTAEDRYPGAYHRAKDLVDPLFEGLPLEELLRLGLGGYALLKEPPETRNMVLFSCSAPQASQQHESRLAAMWKNNHRKCERKKVNPIATESTDALARPRKKGGLVQRLILLMNELSITADTI